VWEARFRLLRGAPATVGHVMASQYRARELGDHPRRERACHVIVQAQAIAKNIRPGCSSRSMPPAMYIQRK